jgi:hypothetical protein
MVALQPKLLKPEVQNRPCQPFAKLLLPSHIDRRKQGNLMTTIDPDILAAREATARALGLDPNTIAWPSGDGEPEETVPISQRLKLDRLSDEEWDIVAGFLPDEPRQAGMTQREFLDAVITVVGRGRAWTELQGLGLSSEAVRKRFARLARKGVWQELAAAAEDLSLSTSRRTVLRTIGHRAQQLTER